MALLSFFNLFFNLLCQLSLAYSPENAAYFFRNIQSPFPSGQASIEQLSKYEKRKIMESNYLVTSGNRSFWIRSKDVVKAPDLSLASNPNGRGVNLLKSHIRETASWKSNVVEELPALTYFEILGYEDSWIKVQTSLAPYKKGFIEANNTILLADFASFALTNENKWVSIKYRLGTDLISAENNKIPLKNVIEFSTRGDLCISTVSSENPRLSIKQNLIIQKNSQSMWVESYMPQFGKVYWQQLNPESKAEANMLPGISTDEIVKRTISSVAFHPKDPKIGLISAQGVFYTVDGTHWIQLPRFKSEDQAVAISKNGDWYVGSLRSTDQGKNFSPYFKIEQIAEILHQKQKIAPKSLRISRLEIQSQLDILKLDIETETRKVSLATRASLIGSTQFPTKWEIY